MSFYDEDSDDLSTSESSAYKTPTESDDDEDFNMHYTRKRKTKKKKSSVNTGDSKVKVPSNLNEWIENNSKKQLYIIRRMIATSFAPGLKIYVIPNRESRNTVDTHYLHLNGWKEQEISGARILKLIKDIVEFQAELSWNNEWVIKLKKIKYNYNSGKYYNETRTINKTVTKNGEIYKWITEFDINNNSISINVEHPTKTKKQLKSAAQESSTSKTSSNSGYIKNRPGKSAAVKKAAIREKKVKWLRGFKEFLAGKTEPEIVGVQDYISKHANVLWALTQPGVFKNNYTYSMALEDLKKRIKPKNRKVSSKKARHKIRVNKKDLSILKYKDLIVISSAEDDNLLLTIKNEENNRRKNIKYENNTMNQSHRYYLSNQQQPHHLRNQKPQNNQLNVTFRQPNQPQFNLSNRPTASQPNQPTLKQPKQPQLSKHYQPQFRENNGEFEFCSLQVGDKVDFRDEYGRFVLCTVIGTQGPYVKLRYDPDYYDSSFDTFIRFQQEPDRFAKAGAFSRKKSNKIYNVQKGDQIKINPLRRHPGWKPGEIKTLDSKSDQVEVRYFHETKRYLYWTHLENKNEINIEKNNNPTKRTHHIPVTSASSNNYQQISSEHTSTATKTSRAASQLIMTIKSLQTKNTELQSQINSLQDTINALKTNQTLFYFALCKKLQDKQSIEYLDKYFETGVMDPRVVEQNNENIPSQLTPVQEAIRDSQNTILSAPHNDKSCGVPHQSSSQQKKNLLVPWEKLDSTHYNGSWLCKSSKCSPDGTVNLYFLTHCSFCLAPHSSLVVNLTDDNNVGNVMSDMHRIGESINCANNVAPKLEECSQPSQTQILSQNIDDDGDSQITDIPNQEKNTAPIHSLNAAVTISDIDIGNI